MLAMLINAQLGFLSLFFTFTEILILTYRFSGGVTFFWIKCAILIATTIHNLAIAKLSAWLEARVLFSSPDHLTTWIIPMKNENSSYFLRCGLICWLVTFLIGRLPRWRGWGPGRMERLSHCKRKKRNTMALNPKCSFILCVQIIGG